MSELPENVALPPTQSALGVALHGRDPTPPIYTEDLLKPVPTTEDLLAPPKGAVVGMKDWFSQQFDELGRMGKGFLRAYEGGLGLSGEDQQYIKDAGLEPFLKDAETNVGKAAQFAARTGVYGIPAALDAVARLPQGILYAVGDVAVEKGIPRDVFGMIEAFPAGHMAGYPGGIPSRMAQIKEWTRGVPERAILNVDKAAEAGAIEGVPPLDAWKENVENGVVEPPPPPRDIHEAARAVAPEVMQRYEADVTRSDFIAGRLDELNELTRNEPENVRELRAAGKTDEAEALMRGIRREMTQLSKEQLEIAHRMDEHFPQVLEAYKRGSEIGKEGAPPTEGITVDTTPPPEVTVPPPPDIPARDPYTLPEPPAETLFSPEARAAPTETAPSLPAVSEALRVPAPAVAEGLADLGGMARGMSENLYKGLFQALTEGKDTYAGMRDPVLVRARPEFEAGKIKSPEDLQAFVQDMYRRPTPPEKIAPKPADVGEALVANKEMTSKVEKALGENKEVTALVNGQEVPIKEVQGNRLVTEDGHKLSVLDVKDGEVTIFHQRTTSIAVDAAKKAEVAGRPAEEAQAVGRLVQAYYRTLADKFEGKLGTAEQLYQKMAPRIRPTDIGTTIQGRTIIGRMRNIIDLTQRADPSTLPHELAHGWLEDMKGLVEHPEAPDSLKADWETVKDAYKMPEKEGMSDKAYKKAYSAFQEKFARGFERYLLEGRAPSKSLDGVFRKFSAWLTDIYQSALGIPGAAQMGDAMRGVYGRLLASKEREAIIAPDRQGLAEAHEAAAATVGLDESIGTANRMAGERAQAAAEVGEEIDAGRRDARRGPPRDDVLSGLFEETGADTGGGGEGAGAPEVGVSRDTSKAAKATPVGEPEPRTFVDADGAPIPENIMDEGDVAEAVRTLAGPDTKRPLTETEKMNVSREFGYAPRDIDGNTIGAVFTPKQVLAAIEIASKQQERVRAAQQRVDTLTGGRGWSRDEAKATSPEIVQAIADYAIEKERFRLITDTIVHTASNMGEAFRLLQFAKHLKTLDEALEFFQKTIKMSPEELAREASLGLRVQDRSQAAKLMQNTSGIATKIGRGFMEGWLSGLFSGMVTQGINLVGNLGPAIMNVPELAVARGISLARGQDFYRGEALTSVMSLKAGAIKGLVGAGRALIDEGYAFRSEEVRPIEHEPAIPTYRLPIPFLEGTWFGENIGAQLPIGGHTLRYPGFQLLATGDEFFKGIAEMDMLHRVAGRVARRDAEREGYIGEDDVAARQTAYINNPTESMLAVVRQHKRYQTFTNELGPYGRSLQAAVNVHPMMSFIFPVVRTGINLFKYAIAERSLLGVLSREQRLKLDGSQGPMVQNMAFSRQAIGNMVLVGAAFAFYEGFLTNGGPTNAGERETQRNVGIQPYAMNTKWGSFSYQAFEPWASILMLATDGMELTQRLWHQNFTDMDIDEKEKYSNETAMRLSLAIQRNLFDKLAIRGLSNMIEAIYSPETSQQSYIESTVSSLIPNFFGQIAVAMDPFERETRTWLDAMLAKVPNYRETLPPKIDRWGQPIPRQGVGQIRWRPPNQGDPVDNAMFRLGMNNAPPQRKIDGIGLTDDQYLEYAQISGQLAKKFLDVLVTPQFSNFPEGIQRKMIGEQIKKARDIGRKMVVQGSLGQGEHDLTARKYLNEMKLLK